MALISCGNFCFAEPPLADGDVVTGGNFSQLLPDTAICAGVRDLTIRGGNWVNVKPQPTWTITGGNWARISRCSHVHADWLGRGLARCAADCIHRSSSDRQWVEIEQDEYRSLRAAAVRRHPHGPLGEPEAIEAVQTREQHAADPDGVISQRFEKLVHAYRDKVLER